MNLSWSNLYTEVELESERGSYYVNVTSGMSQVVLECQSNCRVRLFFLN